MISVPYGSVGNEDRINPENRASAESDQNAFLVAFIRGPPRWDSTSVASISMKSIKSEFGSVGTSELEESR